VIYLQFDVEAPLPGIYTLTVEAFNDLTSEPVSASMSVQVGDKIRNVHMAIQGDIVNKHTVVHVTLVGLGPFYIIIQYGDGYTDTLNSTDPIAMVTSVDIQSNEQNDIHDIRLKHVYKTGGEFNITVMVSNNVNSLVIWELFSPITTMTLTSRSPWIIRSPGHAVVKATIQGGKDLNYVWNFSDNFEDTSVTR